MLDYSEIIEFWFETLSPADWWRKNEMLDSDIRDRFGGIHQAVMQGKTSHWRREDKGRLAEIIVLDQFSRNMFRDRPEAFAADSLALSLAREAVEAGALERMEQRYRQFMLMPYMHSEEIAVHEQGLPLFERYCSANTLEFEKRHAAIIRRFGRYPHRNRILGRESSAEELEFLSQPGSSF